jgi:hypothetical protein
MDPVSMEVVIENINMVRIDDVLYPKECENNTETNPRHLREYKQTLRVLGAAAWPALIKALLTENAEHAVLAMIVYRTDFLACQELDEKIWIEYDPVEREHLEEKLRCRKILMEDHLYRLRVLLLGEERAHELRMDTREFEVVDDPNRVIWD